MSDENVEFIDGESATDVEVDDGISVGAPSLRAALEALLMVTEEPMTTSTLATLTRTPEDIVVATLHDLAQEYSLPVIKVSMTSVWWISSKLCACRVWQRTWFRPHGSY
jgi:hypothetical protein